MRIFVLTILILFAPGHQSVTAQEEDERIERDLQAENFNDRIAIHRQLATLIEQNKALAQRIRFLEKLLIGSIGGTAVIGGQPLVARLLGRNKNSDKTSEA